MSSESIEERDSPLIETVRREMPSVPAYQKPFYLLPAGKDVFTGKGRAAASDELWGIEC